MTGSSTQIIYDDAHIRVIWRPGHSEYALITFGDLLTLVDGHRFVADGPAAKAGLNCIGVMASSGNFFPKSSMVAAAPAILARIGGFAERVTHGASMGGYAAIKYSALLGATAVIALCPQWSIDPEECEGHQPGWRHLLTPALAGMGAVPAEIAGAVFIFSDLFDAEDRFQAGMIRRADPAAVVINVPMVAHHVTGVFAGTKNLINLIDASRRRDVPALVAQARAMRQHHHRRLTGLIEHGIERHPGLTYDIMANRPSPSHTIGPLGARHLFRAVSHFLARGARDAAVGYIETYRYELRDPHDIIQAAVLLGHLAQRDQNIVTHHRTILVYDVGQRLCCHVPAPKPGLHEPVRLQLTGGNVVLFIMLGGIRVELGIGANARLAPQPAGPQSAAWSVFEIGARFNGANNFSAAGNFVSADPEGTVRCDRTIAYEWEHFRLR